jgi:hypothetical protein
MGPFGRIVGKKKPQNFEDCTDQELFFFFFFFFFFCTTGELQRQGTFLHDCELYILLQHVNLDRYTYASKIQAQTVTDAQRNQIMGLVFLAVIMYVHA